jgi:deoxyribodipyrimidine photolyase
MHYYLVISHNFRITDNQIFQMIGDDADTVTVIYSYTESLNKRKTAMVEDGQTYLAAHLKSIGIAIYSTDQSSDKIKKKIAAFEDGNDYKIIEDSVTLLFDDIPKEYKIFTPFLNYHLAHSKVGITSSEVFFKKQYKTKSISFYEKYTLSNNHVSRDEAMAYLEKILGSNIITEYAAKRDFVDEDHTTKLSRWINSGRISVRTIWHKVIETYGSKNVGVKKFLSELVWRDFAYHQKKHNPEMEWKNINPKVNIAYENEKKMFDAWKKGHTGYTIVDAAMNELNETGWMPNRLRMVVASFLTKNLLVSWQQGAQYFLEQLTDADPVINALNWQWVAGTGTDHSPYFRIFNPELQAEKFDPHGTYQKRWAPQKQVEKIVDWKESRAKALSKM